MPCVIWLISVGQIPTSYINTYNLQQILMIFYCLVLISIKCGTFKCMISISVTYWLNMFPLTILCNHSFCFCIIILNKYLCTVMIYLLYIVVTEMRKCFYSYQILVWQMKLNSHWTLKLKTHCPKSWFQNHWDNRDFKHTTNHTMR